MGFAGFSRDDLVEIVELPTALHPWFVATQFHPEFTSTPRDGHPLFAGFIRAARQASSRVVPARIFCFAERIASTSEAPVSNF